MSNTVFLVSINRVSNVVNPLQANQFCAEADGSNTSTSDLEAPFNESLANVAKHHMVLIFTLTSPDLTEQKSFVVGCINVANLDAGCLSDFIDPIILHLYNSGFTVIAEVGDGASENCKLWENWARVPIADFIPESLKDLFPDIDFDPSKIGVRMHPVLNTPIVLLQDMPHALKRINGNLENSSIVTHKRNLCCTRGKPANHNMILVFFLHITNGNQFGLNPTNLTMAHFRRTPMSRMDVKSSAQMCSRRTHAMLKSAVDKMSDEEFRKVSNGLSKGQYSFLLDFIIKVDRFVDIINGIGSDKKKNPFSPKNGESLQKELLGILDYFSKWKKTNDADKQMDETNFLAEATWRGLQQIILGYVVLIQVYCIQKGHTIIPRRTTSDPCEHYFSRGRASFGSTDTGTTQEFNTFLRNESAGINAGYTVRGNNAHAPKD